jgi:general secretion pathway protein E
VANASFFRAQGCAACSGTGYSGRVAVFEFLPVDDAVAGLILHGADPREITRAGRSAGMIGLIDDGLVKAAAGLTSIEEVLRAARAD